jgi:hypothetical protein
LLFAIFYSKSLLYLGLIGDLALIPLVRIIGRLKGEVKSLTKNSSNHKH